MYISVFFFVREKKSVRETDFWRFFDFFHGKKRFFTHRFLKIFTGSRAFSRALSKVFSRIGGFFSRVRKREFSRKGFFFTGRFMIYL